jgi:ethanolamine ammonia-lyase small subunit
MADYKFEFTVSGVNLSDDQKQRISNRIAAAVTQAMVGDSPDLLSAQFLSVCRINGGKNMIGEVAREAVSALEKSNSPAVKSGLNS